MMMMEVSDRAFKLQINVATTGPSDSWRGGGAITCWRRVTTKRYILA